MPRLPRGRRHPHALRRHSRKRPSRNRYLLRLSRCNIHGRRRRQTELSHAKRCPMIAGSDGRPAVPIANVIRLARDANRVMLSPNSSLNNLTFWSNSRSLHSASATPVATQQVQDQQHGCFIRQGDCWCRPRAREPEGTLRVANSGDQTCPSRGQPLPEAAAARELKIKFSSFVKLPGASRIQFGCGGQKKQGFVTHPCGAIMMRTIPGAGRGRQEREQAMPIDPNEQKAAAGEFP